MTQRRIMVRLNSEVPQERAILAHLEQVPPGQWSAEIKGRLYRSLARAPKVTEAASPAVLAGRAERRAAFQPPERPQPGPAAELLGVLSPGEIQLLTTLAWHPYLAPADLAQWLECSESFARPALTFLRAKGVVRDWLRATLPWHRMKYYTLTDFGVQLVAVQEQKSLAEMKRLLGLGARQWGYLEHTVETNRFFLALHARREVGQLIVWHSEAGSRTTFPYAGRRRPGVLWPDGFGEWKEGQWHYTFCVEWDRHSGNPRKLHDKLRLYQDYYTHLLQSPAEHIILPRVLFVARDSNRAKAVLQLAQQVTEQHPYQMLPLFVTDRQSVWQQGPLALIWHRRVDGLAVGPWEEGDPD